MIRSGVVLWVGLEWMLSGGPLIAAGAQEPDAPATAATATPPGAPATPAADGKLAGRSSPWLLVPVHSTIAGAFARTSFHADHQRIIGSAAFGDIKNDYEV
jgi:hypothetical protein